MLMKRVRHELIPGHIQSLHLPLEVLVDHVTSKLSLPAITGVCVVNTVEARMTALASWKLRWSRFISLCSRAMIRNAEWPSLM